jgi:hypothetical protein
MELSMNAGFQYSRIMQNSCLLGLQMQFINSVVPPMYVRITFNESHALGGPETSVASWFQIFTILFPHEEYGMEKYQFHSHIS